MSPHKSNDKCCCDPFKQHKKPILLNLRTLPKFVVDNSDPKYNFSDESKVCVNCLKKINKYAKSVKELFRLFRLPEEIGSSESAVTSPESTATSPDPKEEDTVTSPDPKEEDTITSPDPKDEDTVTSPDPKEEDTVTSPDPKDEDTVTSPDPKEEDTVTSPDPKDEDTVTSPDPKEEDTVTSPDPKEDTVTSPDPKEEDTVTSPDPEEENTVTSPDPKEENTVTSPDPKEDAPLEQTDATPVDLDGLNSESKSKLVSANHKKSSTSRKRKLETEVQDVEPLEKEHLVDSDLERYEKLMNDLTEEFKSASSNKRKLQILTLSPFNVSRTMEMFGATKHMVDKARRLKDKYGVIPEIPDRLFK